MIRNGIEFKKGTFYPAFHGCAGNWCSPFCGYIFTTPSGERLVAHRKIVTDPFDESAYEKNTGFFYITHFGTGAGFYGYVYETLSDVATDIEELNNLCIKAKEMLRYYEYREKHDELIRKFNEAN